jgi:hypothetical protein
MHNIALNYAISNTVVNGPSLTSVTFTIETATTAPTLFALANDDTSGLTSDTNEVTYPQFYAIPNSTKLLFAYRNGGAGGGSGNGDEYIDVYTPGTNTWTHTLFINGEDTSVNAYLNRLSYDSNGNLIATWTWRATPTWQTNSNIMYAQSPDNGTTWYTKGGTNQYTLPIIQTDGTNSTYSSADTSVAQVVVTIPENSSFINQGSMTVDNNNNPIVASYDAPATSSSNYNLQYMVWYYYNGQWNSSQVTNRTSDTSFDSGGGDVRDLGRPLVLVDKQGRVLVVTRSEDTSMGSYSSASTPNNDIVVYYTTTAALDAGTPNWKAITLNTTNMGDYEPTYDQNLWNSQNKLSLFFEPIDRSDLTTGYVQTLDWNEQAYFTPTVATAAAANPSPVTGTTTQLSVLGADVAGQSGLTYTWSLLGNPPAAVSFSDNGDNSAQNTTATFTKTGTYNFLATISDASGLTTTSSVSVTVNQTPTTVAVSPSSGGTLVIGSTQQFAAIVDDQFGSLIASPSLTWSASAGTVSTGGLFTAGQSAGSFSVTATSAVVSGSSTGTVALPPWLGTGSVATWNPATQVLAVTGPTSIIADPGAAEPIVEATGSSAVVTLDPTSGSDIHLGGLSLTNGASADVTSLGSARSITNYRLLVIGTAGATAAPLYTIDSTSTLDLADNDMAVLYGTGASPLTTVEDQLEQAYDGGHWNDPGLTSSAAAAEGGETALGLGEASTLGLTTFDGLTLGGNAVLVKYTVVGDTNLDGSVGLTDYNAVLANYNGNGQPWTSGSFDYSGNVGLADYNAVLADYNQTLANYLPSTFSSAITTSLITTPTSSSTTVATSTATPAKTPAKATIAKPVHPKPVAAHRKYT